MPNPTDLECCDLCGEPATWLMVDDTVDRETGYVDSVRACQSCAEAKGWLPVFALLDKEPA
jgi:hypothetical protein